MRIQDTCPICGHLYYRRSGQQPPGGPCPPCRRRRDAAQQRQLRRLEYRCISCGRPARAGYATCLACSVAATERNRLRRARARTGVSAQDTTATCT